MTSQEVRAKQLAEGDTRKCVECGKVVAWDEYVVNFGWCDECIDKHIKEVSLV